MFKFNRNTTEWTMAHGKRCLVKDLKDDHLLNIIGHLKNKVDYMVSEEGGWSKESFIVSMDLALFKFFIDEARYRGLGFMVFLKEIELMPWEIPFKDSDGKKKYYDLRVNRYVEVKDEEEDTHI